MMVTHQHLQRIKRKAPPWPQRPKRPKPERTWRTHHPQALAVPLTTAVGKGAGIDWIAQHQMDGLVRRLGPDQLTTVRPTVAPAGHPQPVVAEEVEHGRRRAGALE